MPTNPLRREKPPLNLIKSNKTALLFGGSGLTGGHLLRLLAKHDNYAEVISFGRKKSGIEHPKIKETVIDFERMSDYGHLIKGDDLFLCLGTTIKKAGSQEAFRRVDFEYTYQAAQIAAQNGVKQLLLVSSVGADADSSVFYSRVKGETEDAVRKLPFWAVRIFRPSVLLGARDETRIGESIAQTVGRFLNRFTTDLFDLYQPVKAEKVAAAMVTAAQNLQGGEEFFASHEINKGI